jgi:ribosomal protein S6--L-glutamate ligase
VVVGYPQRLVADHRALLAAAADAGLAAELVDPSRLGLAVVDGRVQGLVDGEPRTPAAVLPRGVNRPWPFVRQVCTAWARAGAVVLPTVAAADRCADKLETLGRLAERGVPVMPAVGVLPGPGTALGPLAATPVLVTKPARASKGRGVSAADAATTHDHLRTVLPLVDGHADHQVVQPRASGWGVDHRVVVADGTVVAMTRRTAPPGGLVTNAPEARVEDVVDPAGDEPEVAAVALAAAAALDLEFGGIDVIVDAGRAVVLEANAWPGLAAHVRGPAVARVLVGLVRRALEPAVDQVGTALRPPWTHAARAGGTWAATIAS